jgi:hypothetical protein
LFYGVGPFGVYEAELADPRQLAALRDVAGTSEPKVVDDHKGRGVADPVSLRADSRLSAASLDARSLPRLQLSGLLAQEAANPCLSRRTENVRRVPTRRHH